VKDNFYLKCLIKDNLLIIAKRLQKIEDRYPNYHFKRIWIDLRIKQEKLYSALRCLENENQEKLEK